jgi:hypothetical protein
VSSFLREKNPLVVGFVVAGNIKKKLMPKDIHYIPNFNEVAHIEREMVLRTLLSNYFRVVQIINDRAAQTSGPGVGA